MEINDIIKGIVDAITAQLGPVIKEQIAPEIHNAVYKDVIATIGDKFVRKDDPPNQSVTNEKAIKEVVRNIIFDEELVDESKFDDLLERAVKNGVIIGTGPGLNDEIRKEIKNIFREL